MLNISIILNGKAVEGGMCETDFSKDGVLVEADFEPAIPMLAIGSEMTTRLSGPNQRRPLDLVGHVVLQARKESHIRCGFTYSVDELQSIRDLMYRRGAVRVRPSATLPVGAAVPEGVSVQVHDISTNGLSLLLTEEEQALLFKWTIQMSIRLPGQGEKLDLHGNVRVRKLAGAAILYGIEFDGTKTSDFAQKQELIHHYVMRRQAELLQQRAARRAG